MLQALNVAQNQGWRAWGWIWTGGGRVYAGAQIPHRHWCVGSPTAEGSLPGGSLALTPLCSQINRAGPLN